MSINKDNIFDDTRVNSSRRRLLAAGGVIAAASLASAIPVQAAKKNPPPMETQMFPKFYPLADFQPEVSVAGKFIVITGASRGIGRATGEALLRSEEHTSELQSDVCSSDFVGASGRVKLWQR